MIRGGAIAIVGFGAALISSFGPAAYPEWKGLWAVLFWGGVLVAFVGCIWFLLENCPMSRDDDDRRREYERRQEAAYKAGRNNGSVLKNITIRRAHRHGLSIPEGANLTIENLEVSDSGADNIHVRKEGDKE
jgi:hypothetical protein